MNPYGFILSFFYKVFLIPPFTATSVQDPEASWDPHYISETSVYIRFTWDACKNIGSLAIPWDSDSTHLG